MSQAWRMERSSSDAGSSLGGAGCSRISEDPTESFSFIGLLPQSLSLPVARGLVALILSMDFTCNSDLFLLSCKVCFPAALGKNSHVPHCRFYPASSVAPGLPSPSTC